MTPEMINAALTMAANRSDDSVSIQSNLRAALLENNGKRTAVFAQKSGTANQKVREKLHIGIPP